MALAVCSSIVVLILTLSVLISTILIFQNVSGLPTRVDPIVETPVGTIRGLPASDGDYSMYLGIPYATVDENNPFGPSIPHPGFDEIFVANDDSAQCPQLQSNNNTIVGTLDCLHLNIYVPNTASSSNRLPVLVWIHGGGFTIGSGGRYVYGANYLVRHDVILVSLNYRLGPYGFMCLDIPEVPGNQGFKDQLTALRWINNNIESFDGDVSRITIFGNSAGSMSVDAHLHSEQEMLFNNVIMQSGTTLAPTIINEPDPSYALRLADQLGFQTDDSVDALSFLATVDTNLVIAHTLLGGYQTSACVEREFDNVERFISDYTINRNIPKANGIPVLLGYNNDEMSAEALAGDALYENYNFGDRLLRVFNLDNDRLAEMASIVRRFYTGDEDLSEKELTNLINFSSDVIFNYPTDRSVARYIDNGASNVFYYVFSYDGDRNFFKRTLNITFGNATHADELGYLFDISFWPEDPTPEDQLVIDRMTSMWTNFAKYGDPTPETSVLLPVKWEPITRGSPYYYLDINLELSLGRRPFHDRMAFWDLFYSANWNYQWELSTRQ